MSRPAATLSASVDCSMVESDDPGRRTVELVVRGAEAPKPDSRLPLNLALVIDRSGSMDGEKLSYACEGARRVLDLLTPADRVGITAYDDSVWQVASNKPATQARVSELRARVASLRSGGSTDLASGWLQGAAQVAESMMPDGVNRVLLLTDGQANVGLTDPEALAAHARGLRERGVSTSTFGIGYGFNEHLLEAMASAGGGHFYYLEQPRDMPAIFARELGEMLSVVAAGAVVTFRVPQGCRIQLLGGLEHEAGDGAIRVPLGDLFAQEERRLFVRVTPRPGQPGSAITILVSLDCRDMDGEQQCLGGEVTLAYASREEVDRAPRDKGLLARSAEVELAAAATEALKLEREGRRSEASMPLYFAAAAARDYVPESTVDEYTELANDLAAGLTEQQRKDRQYREYRLRTFRRE